MSCGGVVSTTWIVKLFELLFPDESDAVQTTVVRPRWNVLPEGGAHATVGVAS